MTLFLRAIVLLIAVVGTEGVVFAVLQKNLEAGTYSVDADSIGLPLLTTAFVLLVFAALVAVGLLCAGRSRWLALSGAVALAVAALLAVSYGLTWADSDHWPVAFPFCALALAMPVLANLSSQRISVRQVP